MREKKVVLTRAGLANLESELQELKLVERRKIAEKIKEARGQGDLSENAEYDAAKEEQARIETRIAELEKMLRNVEIIDDTELDKSKIRIGCTVELLDLELNQNVIYKIVGSTEADPMNGKISNESPLGVSLLDHIAGDTIEFMAPKGAVAYKILKIL